MPCRKTVGKSRILESAWGIVVPKAAGLNRGWLLGVCLLSYGLLIAASIFDVLHFGSQVQITGGLSAILDRKLSVLDVAVNLS